jgi:DNA-binding NarL/FixJ family response regulator
LLPLRHRCRNWKVTSIYRILIVDDHPLVRAGFAQLIGDSNDLEVCDENANMADGLNLVKTLTPDVSIIDLSLAGGSGLDLIKHIRAQGHQVLILVASMHDELLYADRVITGGAQGYINKQEAQDKIITAIRQVLLGKQYLSKRMTERFQDTPNFATRNKRAIKP